MSTRRAIFQREGKVPTLRHVLYMCRSNEGLYRAITFRTSDGMPSGPGAFLFFDDLIANCSSSSLKSGHSEILPNSTFGRSWCVGNNDCTTFVIVDALRSFDGLMLPIFLLTILNPWPQGSLLISSVNRFQQCILLRFIACRRSFFIFCAFLSYILIITRPLCCASCF